MSSRARAAALLGSLPVLLAALIGPAQAAPTPVPSPAARVELPEGPWPPDEILARDPADVRAPALAATTAGTTVCPPAAYGVRHYAPGSGKTVALTFDDGPGVTTSAILSILQRYGIPATFFNLGINASVRPTLVRSEPVIGSVIGNHTWDHPQMPTLSPSRQASEMDQATAEQNALTGIGSCVFRPPYGEYDATTLTLAQQRRMAVWNWSVDTEDWKAGTSTSSSWVERIYSRAVAGGSQLHPVILMHNPPGGIPATVTALPRIIDYYRSHGYQFVDLLGGTGRRVPTPAAATTAGGLHVFTRTAGGNVAERTLAGGTWSGSTSLSGTVVGGPAAAAVGPATAAVVAIGTDNSVYRRTVTDSGGGSGWSSLGGVVTTRPGLAVAPSGVESVVVRAATAQAAIRQRTGTSWGAWQSLGGTLAPFAPAAAVTANGLLTVAVVGTDRAVYVNTSPTAGGWSGWRRIGGTTDADVGLTATADGTRLLAVVRATNHNAYVSVGSADGSTWSAWTTLGGLLASAPAATVDGAALEVVAAGTDGRLYRNTAVDGTGVTGWTGWRALP